MFIWRKRRSTPAIRVSPWRRNSDEILSEEPKRFPRDVDGCTQGTLLEKDSGAGAS